MSATYDNILADLKRRFGDALVLSPKDIAPSIKQSEGVQANLRSDGRFPLPLLPTGTRKVAVSIYHLAEYLAYGKVKSVDDTGTPTTPSPAPTPSHPKVKKPKTKENGEYDYLLAWQASLDYQYELIREIEALELADKTDTHPPSLPTEGL